MAVVLLILHSLFSVLLIGALTHQFVVAWWRASAPRTSFVARVRTVQPSAYTNAVIVLYIVTWLFGAIIYPAYTLGPRVGFRMEEPLAFGVFEVKEHFAAIGLGVLPAYWYLWRAEPHSLTARMTVTLLTTIVWFDFLSGHVLNNLGGL